MAWRKLRFWTITGRLRCLGVIHLDDLPPVGTIRFEQPSGLPVLTIALDPASVESQDTNLDAMSGGPDVVDGRRQRWWTLQSESLEILPSGTWLVTATLSASGTPRLVELHLEIDPAAGSHDWLVLRGRGMLDRGASGTAGDARILNRQIRLDLRVHARRVVTGTSTESQQDIHVVDDKLPPGATTGWHSHPSLAL